MRHSFNPPAFGDRIAGSFRRRRVQEAVSLQPSGANLMRSMGPPCAGNPSVSWQPDATSGFIPLADENRVKT